LPALWDDDLGQCVIPQTQKNAGPPLACNGSNPVNGATGNKYQAETDYAAPGRLPLEFKRYYNSAYNDLRALGPRWRHSYDRQLTLSANNADAVRPDGRAYHFIQSGANWLPDTDVNDKLSPITNGWRYVLAEDDSSEYYDADGRLTAVVSREGLAQDLVYDAAERLVSVTDRLSGRQLLLTYDALNRLVTLTDPAGHPYTYQYDANGRLSTVLYPDATPTITTDNPKRIYAYEDTRFPDALTGITDENGARFATYAYDAQGRGISTEHAGGVEKTTLVYNADGSTSVTDALGSVRTHTFQTVLGVVKSTGQSQPAGSGCAAAASALSYDANGNVASRTDFNASVTNYAYDLTRNLETSRTEASGKPEARTISTQWHPTFRLPSQITEPGLTSTFTYDADGNRLTKTVTDPAAAKSRTWTYTYNPLGQVLSEDGPRTEVSDVTTYAYDPLTGNLTSITNALGHVTTFSNYDAHGRAGRITDPNGLIVNLTYDARGRLTKKTRDGKVTTYAYDAAGNLIKVTQPTGTFLQYAYDAAHRLTDIRDKAGNKIHYTLDAAGNRTGEDVFDPAGVLKKTHRQAFDALSRLAEDIGAAAQSTDYAYDANGNLTRVTDPNAHASTRAYDALNRLIQATDPLAGVTRYAYDALDQLTDITDANALTTRYAYDGLGNRIQQTSPNTGLMTATYDAAGNPLSRTDANGVIATTTYDVLNRPVTINYPGTEADVAFTWDSGTNQKGFLKKIQRGLYSVNFSYDKRGNVIYALYSKSGVSSSGKQITYAYNNADQITRIRFAASRDIAYLYNSNGQVSEVRLIDHTTPGNAAGDVTRTLASNIRYLPFGPLTSLTYGNGLSLQRTFDADYRLSAQSVGSVQSLSYAYDLAGNLQGIDDPLHPAESQSFAADPLDRLLHASGSYGALDYSYDATGNRLQAFRNANQTDYRYGLTDQRLASLSGAVNQSFAYDATGNATHGDPYDFAYTPDQRMKQVRQGTNLLASYGVNGLGQRVEKTTAGGSLSFDYDLAGQLLRERESSRAYVTLNGERLGFVDGSDLYYTHNTHLGAPQAVTNQAQQVVWQANYEPFGQASLVNPSLTLNPRLPGQYFDAETGLHYNYFRDSYFPDLGRYGQSDPIGLAGGMNTYLYANANPLSYTDPLGLNPGVGCLAGAWAGPLGCGVGAGIGTAIMGGVALAAILSTPGDTTKPEQCTDKPCPPCKTVSGKIVPVGTIGYRPLDTPSRPQHGIVGPHYNIYKANQYPAPKCDCFWQPVGAVPPSGLPAGAIPIEPFAN
jgi:RHS repeat-associated protein